MIKEKSKMIKVQVLKQKELNERLVSNNIKAIFINGKQP
jgi:hypothetical protein